MCFARKSSPDRPPASDTAAGIAKPRIKSDTVSCIAAITGSIAEAFYGVPEELRQECRKRLTPELAEILHRWESTLYNEKSVVEFEIENRIRRGFHDDSELFRCA